MAERQAKQDYLRDEIANKGYDQVEFATYITAQKRTQRSFMFTLYSERHRY